MHLADTREQARRDIEAAIIPNWVSYLETVGARQLAANGGEAVEKWTTEGLGLAGGVATVGTPDDAIETIRRLMAKSGGFGAFLLMAHNAAPWPATRRSYELFAEYVIPEIRRLNDGRYGSMNWYRQNAREFRREGTSAINEANRRYGTESRLPEVDDDAVAPIAPGAGG
jgi:limonene 1,2-monooxygenase